MRAIEPVDAPAGIFWRRLDVPGCDAACFRPDAGGGELSGMAVFHEDQPTALEYSVRCDSEWRTTDARVRGWRGPAAVDLRLSRGADGVWSINQVVYPAVAGCIELDLNFTPATNLLPLRRLSLAIGQAAEVRSAWLEWPEARLLPLVQRYLRRSPAEYDYEADLPDGSTFTAVLRVDPAGWVLDYGRLWRALPGG